MSIYTQIAQNKRRSWLIILTFIAVIAGLSWLFSQALQAGYLLFVIATVMAIITSGFSYFFSDKVALSMAGATQVTKQDEPRLYRTVENLSIGAGITPPPKVYLIEDEAINAFATGRDPRHATIAVTRGALQKLDDLELEGVIAHELSHIRNYDIRTMSIAVVLVGIIALAAEFFLRAQWFGNRRDEGKSSGLIFIFALLGAILAPLVANLLKLALSRQREFLADASAALLTRYPQGLANALEKIALDSRALKRANAATAHLYLSNPFGSKGEEDKTLGERITHLFSTHPPIEERIRRLREM